MDGVDQVDLVDGVVVSGLAAMPCLRLSAVRLFFLCVFAALREILFAFIRVHSWSLFAAIPDFPTSRPRKRGSAPPITHSTRLLLAQGGPLTSHFSLLTFHVSLLTPGC